MSLCWTRRVPIQLTCKNNVLVCVISAMSTGKRFTLMTAAKPRDNFNKPQRMSSMKKFANQLAEVTQAMTFICTSVSLVVAMNVLNFSRLEEERVPWWPSLKAIPSVGVGVSTSAHVNSTDAWGRHPNVRSAWIFRQMKEQRRIHRQNLNRR